MAVETLLWGLAGFTAWAILELIKRICNIPEDLE